MDLCNYQAKSHRVCMQISESDHCDSDLTENQSDYNTLHHKISRFSILISIGTWENRGQTDAPPVTSAHAGISGCGVGAPPPRRPYAVRSDLYIGVVLEITTPARGQEMGGRTEKFPVLPPADGV